MNIESYGPNFNIKRWIIQILFQIKEYCSLAHYLASRKARLVPWFSNLNSITLQQYTFIFYKTNFRESVSIFSPKVHVTLFSLKSLHQKQQIIIKTKIPKSSFKNMSSLLKITTKGLLTSYTNPFQRWSCLFTAHQVYFSLRQSENVIIFLK